MNNVESICPNCSRTILENFCGNCGQKRFKKIDRKYVWDEIQYSLVHTNKGFLYSVKKILINPGKTAREFIDGNRVNHYKPILLAFLLSGISAFISYKIINLGKLIGLVFEKKYMFNGANKEQFMGIMNNAMSFMQTYNSFMMLAMIPAFAIIAWLAFIKWGQNYYEHVIMSAYMLCFYTLINILIIYPLMYLLRTNLEAFELILTFSMIIGLLVMLWFYIGFYKEKSFSEILARMLLFIVLGGIAYVGLIIIVGIGYLIFYGKEALFLHK